MHNTLLIIGCIAFVVLLAVLAFWKGKQFLNLPQWARLSIAGGVLVGMFLLIHFAWEDHEKTEPTLVTICWNDAGQAVYQEYQDCAPAEELVWTKQNKKVYWGLSAEYDVYRSGFEGALKYWNENLDHEAFVETRNVENADVIIVEGAINVGDKPHSMGTSHIRTNGEITAMVTVTIPGDSRRFMLAMQHELGHCLGLAHDEGGSIMNRTLPEPRGKLMFWYVSDKDKKRLREVMGL